MIFLNLCNSARYVTLTTNLTLIRKIKIKSTLPFGTFITINTWVALRWNPWELLPLICFFLPGLVYGNMFTILTFREALFQLLFVILSINIFCLAPTSCACILVCLLVFQTWCLSFTRKSFQWLEILLIILANDVRHNPCPPFHNSFFTFN